MSKAQDVLIIGGGVIGVCAAYYLSERGHSVTLVEQGEISSGASYGNAGLIVPSHTIPLAAPGVPRKSIKWMLNPESPLYIKPRLSPSLAHWLLYFLSACREAPMKHTATVLNALGAASAKLYQQLAEVKEMDIGYEQKGIIYMYNTKAGLQHGREEAELVSNMGVHVIVLESREAVLPYVPNAKKSIIGGVLYPHDGHLIPDRFVREMARLAEKRGVCIKTDTEVMRFEKKEGRISKVITTRGDFTPDRVVMAAGAWSPIVSRDLGFRIPVQPAKGYSITMKRLPGIPDMPVYFGERKVVLTPMGDTMRLAGTLELAGHTLTINKRRVNAIRKAVPDYLPGLEDAELIEIWRGLRPLTPDTLPIIGPSKRVSNLIFATGHGMLGMSLGPVTGELVARMVDNEKLEDYVHALRVERF